MQNKVNIQWNKFIHLEDSMGMYGVYNAETLEKLITTVQKCIDLLPQMKYYLPVNFVLSLPGI